jgi:hypothetical protein
MRLAKKARDDCKRPRARRQMIAVIDAIAKTYRRDGRQGPRRGRSKAERA